MKKTLLIIAIVLCVAVAGTALALTVNNASNVTGTLTADSYLALSLDGSSSAASISVADGDPGYYTIVCNVTKSASVTDNGTLTITLANTSESVTLGAVTVTLYEDELHNTPVTSGSRKGAGTITVSNISTTTTYYAVVTLDSGLNENQTNAVGGTMTLSFAKPTVNP